MPQLEVPSTALSFPADALHPGAMRSGLMRPSLDHPRDENGEMLSSLVAIALVRVLPTESPFLLVDGLEIEKSVSMPPLLPPANTIKNSRCSHMKRSTSCERAEQLLLPGGGASSLSPQESLWTLT